MPFEKGQKKVGGRKKNSLKKTTQDVRKAIAKFAEGNVHRLEGWLNEIAKDDPQKAASLFLQVIEYHIPKLARQEITGKDGETLNVKFEVMDKETADKLKDI